MLIEYWTLALVGVTSLLLCGLLALTPVLASGPGKLAQDLTARQALHKVPTPRIGGVAILLCFGLCLLFHFEDLQSDLVASLAAGLVVFVVGMREDILRDVSPRIRLLAALVSGALAVATTGLMVPGLGLTYVDQVFSFSALALLVTLLWSAGTCHSLNLIDGLNGFASGYAICAATALLVIAGMHGESDLQFTALVLIASLSGFLLLNWPFGRIFLGDAGAYAIGHILAWLGILLLARNPEISGFAILLILFWPVGETTYSIIRRRLARKATGEPDRLHAHHVMVRGLAQLLGPSLPPLFRNSLASLLLLPFAVAPMVVGVLFSTSPGPAALALGFFTALYILSYQVALKLLLAKRLRRRRRPARSWQLAPDSDISALSGPFRRGAERFDITIYRPKGQTAWSVTLLNGRGEKVHWWSRYKNDSLARAAVTDYLAANTNTSLADLDRA